MTLLLFKIYVDDIINFTLGAKRCKKIINRRSVYMELQPVSTVLEELRSSMGELRESL